MKFSLQMLEGKKQPVALEELLAFRFEDGMGFPASYIEFAKQYGYGITCGEFLIYVPLGDYCDSFKNQSRAIQSTYSDVLGSAEDVWFDLAPDVDFEKLKRLIPFAGSENGNYLFWDPLRTTTDEMDIYITDFRGLGFVKAATNIRELVEKMTSAERYKEVFPLFYNEPLPAIFRPLQKHI